MITAPNFTRESFHKRKFPRSQILKKKKHSLNLVAAVRITGLEILSGNRFFFCYTSKRPLSTIQSEMKYQMSQQTTWNQLLINYFNRHKYKQKNRILGKKLLDIFA